MDRGAYNKGSNSVNVMLNLMPPGYNKSGLDLPGIEVYSQPLWWVLQSADPTWQSNENKTVNDHFNFTTTKSTDSFSLAGILDANQGSQGFSPISMPTCYSSYYYGNYTLAISDQPANEWWSTQGWTDFKLPSMNATFNEKTADFILEGKFVAYPYLRANDTGYIGTADGGEISIGDSVQGTIRLTFKGELDTYHSDVLDMNTTTPTWLRTVGFGNNSMNAGYASGGYGRPGVGAGVIVVLLSVFAVLV
ncbi:Transcription factor [Penicillium cataractarum]|uniref:Transcription factor n=1 Tax=Penicillium cataractarum TaxID=2100454 RepID=A0A9W9SLV3_9EURO|nr:Transcription factor [Penicillium cataractarum]KAJ5380872.1 Transcription factor [Penicillium cataractarum]